MTNRLLLGFQMNLGIISNNRMTMLSICPMAETIVQLPMVYMIAKVRGKAVLSTSSQVK